MSSSIEETSYWTGDKFGEDEEEQEEIKETYSDKDSILFAIDCSVDMVTKDSEGNLPLHKIFTSLKSTILSKIFTRPFDQVGVVLFNTKNKDTETRQDHIYVLDELDIPDAPRIKGIENLIKDQDKFQDKFGSSEEEVALSEVLYTCSEIFSDNAPKLASKRIFLITNQDNPNSTQPQYRATTIQRTKDFLAMGIEIELFGLDKPDHKFDYSLFYEDVLSTENIARNKNSVCTIDNLGILIQERQAKKRSVFSIPFKIAEDLVIGVKGYAHIIEQKVTSHIQLATSGQQVKPVKSVTRMRCADSHQFITQSDIKYSFDYGGEKVIFTEAEMKQLHNLKVNEPGFKLIGFKKTSSILSYYNIVHPYFIYPDDMQYEGSTRVFFKLLNSMHKKGRTAVCALVRRANADLRLVALIPQKEELDNDGFQLKPPGFNVIMLPFADEIRSVPVDETPTPEQAQIEVLVDMIEKATIPSYNPVEHINPLIEKHNNMIKAIALEQELEEPAKTLVPIPQLLEAFDKVSEFKTLVHLENHTSEAILEIESGKRKAKEPSNAEPKRAKADESIEDCWKNNRLKLVRNDDLKTWLNENGVSPARTKKDLIDQVDQLLNARALQ
ncbi:ATP-dependent DNA helicase ii [Backusella circina FSU 941]|nr:ATP-dependent DNA helicase ii [Backusella circina FSU 941]